MDEFEQRDHDYKQAKLDPIAAIILNVLHDQDAATYNGYAGNMGQRALHAARRIHNLLAETH